MRVRIRKSVNTYGAVYHIEYRKWWQFWWTEFTSVDCAEKLHDTYKQRAEARAKAIAANLKNPLIVEVK